jgi:hypothetical protein
MLKRLWNWLWPADPKPQPKRDTVDHQAENRVLKQLLEKLTPAENGNFGAFRELASEMIEARMMGGSGPHIGMPRREMLAEANKAMFHIQEAALKGLTEALPSNAYGAFGDIELALQNVDWRREIGLSWMEFSRWGVQQIILMSRLYYIKQATYRRAIDVIAAYVFGRGVEVSSSDPDANDTLNEFYERNRATFGPAARIASQRSKSMDGNLFWVFFSDTQDKGTVDARRLDTTEIQEIITDPEDAEREILYRRVYSSKTFDVGTGASSVKSQTCWYPALNAPKPVGAGDTIGGDPVYWDRPVYHRKGGSLIKWTFGVPEGYPAMEWTKTGARYMQSCATLAASHAQIAWDITTKGGQGAIAGIKNQMGTTVNSQGQQAAWDTNPAAVDGSSTVHGPGTEWKMVNSRGMGLDPKEGLTYNIPVGNAFGIPPTWLGDMETSNLSTATTLDRPTELGMRARQIEWEDDDTIIAKYVLSVSAGAANGKLREALRKREIGDVRITECVKHTLPNGDRVYEAFAPKADEIQVRVTFPAIREGDLPALITAISTAMTLENKGGQIVGIDEREGVRMLYETLGQEDPEEILDKQYPDHDSGKKGTPEYAPAYDPCRTKEPLPPPVGKALPAPGGLPQNPGGNQPVTPTGPQDKPVTAVATEAIIGKLAALVEAVRRKKGA